MFTKIDIYSTLHPIHKNKEVINMGMLSQAQARRYTLLHPQVSIRNCVGALNFKIYISCLASFGVWVYASSSKRYIIPHLI